MPSSKDQCIALLCTLHPASLDKQERCLSLLRHSARSYYREPSANCTAWSYSTRFPPPKKQNSAFWTILGLEIYTTKSALQQQLDDPVFFQSYHQKVKEEGLYEREEELVAWYQSAGFVLRSGRESRDGGAGNLVSMTSMVCKEGEGAKGVVELIRPFAEWVRTNEADVLTYVAFTRPKAPGEVLLYIRYRDVKALKGHDGASEHKVAVKELEKHLSRSIAQSTTLWKEVEDSFVIEGEGALHGTGTAKL